MSSRVRRRRGAQESLLSVVLASESIVVFLGGLVAYGLKALPAGIDDWWGIVAGGALAVVMLATSGLLRHRWAVYLGAVLQVVLALGAFFVPALLIAAAVFGALYVYATIKGGALDERNASLAAQAERNGD
ncbi:DUF4233 domain-containing protein [Microbacterium sp. 179-B 1A2 NHS]|uniref:DUF4233 domain-containing protein n=1 Tax=Microbacterium sp. 179-B 1A2 NHS TaxID=3142383 RepID=UPI0039A113C0